MSTSGKKTFTQCAADKDGPGPGDMQQAEAVGEVVALRSKVAGGKLCSDYESNSKQVVLGSQ